MTRRSAQRWAAAIGVALLIAHGAPTLAEDSAPAAPAPEITVTAPRGLTVGGIAPLLELSPSELDSYGADTLSDLVDALKPLTRSSRSDGAPVVLINGHLAGPVEFANLPGGAIERVEVLPETVAPQPATHGQSWARTACALPSRSSISSTAANRFGILSVSLRSPLRRGISIPWAEPSGSLSAKRSSRGIRRRFRWPKSWAFPGRDL